MEKRLRQALQEQEVDPSPSLKGKVLNQIRQKQKKSKTAIIAGIILAFFIFPASAFAYQTFLADELYGSFDSLKNRFAGVTMETYFIINAKLSQAKGELNSEEYAIFKEQLKVITSSKVEWGDSYGNIDYDSIPGEDAKTIKEALIELQPFFDRLNGLKSSKEVLTEEEYLKYIEALMTYEKILVQSGINPSVRFEVEEVLPSLQEDLIAAQQFMQEVDERQR
ncbi:DUF3600 domain-containing protein [Halalkalibacter akibai]|uniref:DUF3600 domain-containing protein n=1 Tax=Halalkalibacter akibai (strain ATCC 43226 / DSM 21942 / CIP 109018 / JCM 9157 / 1139) TaxID=1236973 RepID=W4QPK8_HALA3|nr:DUF3600 domain-containing protein [Halalkalibacter akibai]GAE33996.1 hypothetical protein JCM9157_1026 [Halalkalibacter akibai JCM 9157]